MTLFVNRRSLRACAWKFLTAWLAALAYGAAAHATSTGSEDPNAVASLYVGLSGAEEGLFLGSQEVSLEYTYYREEVVGFELDKGEIYGAFSLSELFPKLEDDLGILISFSFYNEVGMVNYDGYGAAASSIQLVASLEVCLQGLPCASYEIVLTGSNEIQIIPIPFVEDLALSITPTEWTGSEANGTTNLVSEWTMALINPDDALNPLYETTLFFELSISAVPEPTSTLLFGMGLAGLAFLGRRRAPRQRNASTT